MGGSDSPGLIVGFGWWRRCVGVVGTTLAMERGYDDDDEEEKKSVGSGVCVPRSRLVWRGEVKLHVLPEKMQWTTTQLATAVSSPF